jgi:hypothetical protein
MSQAVGLMLPFAVGIALSPVPIAAVILMMLSLHPGIGGRMFVAGWAVGLLVAVVVLTTLLGWLGVGAFATPLRLLLGVVLLVFAWERASAGGGSRRESEGPAWVSGLDRLAADRAFAMGALQAGLDPRKLVLIAAVGMLFVTARLPTGEALIASLAFSVVGSLGVAAPLVVGQRAGTAGRARLDAVRARLVEDNSVITAVTLLLLGALLVGQGLAGL